MSERVTDPELLKLLNSSAGGAAGPVTDPMLLQQLNADQTTAGQRFGYGFRAPARGAAQLLSRGVEMVAPAFGADAAKAATGKRERIDASVAQQEQDYQAQRGGNAGTFDMMGTLGSAAQTIPLSMLIPSGAGFLSGAASGAAQGGMSGALTPVAQNQENFATQKVMQTGIGTGLGALTGGATGWLQNLFTPRSATDAARDEALKRFPGMGESVMKTQAHEIERWNRETWQKAIASSGQTIGDDIPAGHTMAQRANEIVTDTFKRAWDGKMVSTVSAGADLAGLPRDVSMLGETAGKQFAKRVSEALSKTGDGVNGTVVRESIDTLRGYANKAGDAPEGQLYQRVADAVESAALASNPEVAAAVQSAKSLWANVNALNTAASKNKATGIFTPQQLATGVGTEALTNKAVAMGQAPMQNAVKDGFARLGEDAGRRVAPKDAAGIIDFGSRPWELLHYPRWLGHNPLGRSWNDMLLNNPNAADTIAEIMRRGAPVMSGGAASVAPMLQNGR